LKVVEVKSEEHREHECKIWLRIAKERGIDVTTLVGEEYKPLKEIVNEEKK
jgi:peptide subunit release factor RF-3